MIRLQVGEDFPRVAFDGVQKAGLLDCAIAELKTVTSVRDRARQTLRSECAVHIFVIVAVVFDEPQDLACTRRLINVVAPLVSHVVMETTTDTGYPRSDVPLEQERQELSVFVIGHWPSPVAQRSLLLNAAYDSPGG
jgi:hypothetical protein